MKLLLAGAALAAPFALAAPAAAQDTPEALQEAFAAAVEAEDAAAVAALYVEGGVSYGPGGDTAVGADEITASWTSFFDDYDGFSLEIVETGARGAGKTHASWGTWTMSASPVDGGEPMMMTGRYTDVSEKTKDGWRFVADHASLTAAPSDE